MNPSHKQVLYRDFQTYVISNIICVSALLFDMFSIIKPITNDCNSNGNIRLPAKSFSTETFCYVVLK